MNPLPLRAVIAFLALPGAFAFIVPLWIATQIAPRRAFDPVAFPVLAAGIFLLSWCVRIFYVAGRGTLAPWAPPKRLVVVGLYGFSRNPMYIAVIVILLAWAIGFRSLILVLYAAALATLFHLRVVLHEEPWLEKQFGEDWMRYRAHLPRWIGRWGGGLHACVSSDRQVSLAASGAISGQRSALHAGFDPPNLGCAPCPCYFLG
jgi:protein-S-isoprenylcysteine O-methyltransferase Ste14